MQGLAGGSRPCSITVTRRVPLTKTPMCQSNAALRNGGAEMAGTLDVPRKCGMAEQAISASPYLPQMTSSLSRVKWETNAEVKAPKLSPWETESEAVVVVSPPLNTTLPSSKSRWTTLTYSYLIRATSLGFANMSSISQVSFQLIASPFSH